MKFKEATIKTLKVGELARARDRLKIYDQAHKHCNCGACKSGRNVDAAESALNNGNPETAVKLLLDAAKYLAENESDPQSLKKNSRDAVFEAWERMENDIPWCSLYPEINEAWEEYLIQQYAA